MSWNFEGWFPWDAECFRLKNIQIRETVSTKIACTVLSLALSKASECRQNHSGCTLFEFIKEPLHIQRLKKYLKSPS